MTNEDGAVAAALACLAEFRRRTLPGFWRRLAHWKGVHEARNPDLVEDLDHDLLVDCLSAPAAIVAMPPEERHRRWLRLLQQRFYAQHERDLRRHVGPGALAEVCAPDIPASDLRTALEQADLDENDRAVLARVLAHARYLGNGRLSAIATARAAGLHPAAVRTLWEKLAERFGRGPEWLESRRRRLAEALCAMAGSRLPAAPALDPTGIERPPDPDAARVRVRSIVRSLEGRPLSRELRGIVASLRSAGGRAGSHDPSVLLPIARLAAPADPRVALWEFEAARARGDLPSAVAALRRARRLGADRAAVAVARARLLVQRGRPIVAEALLERARRRGPDVRIRSELEAIAALERAPLRKAPSVRTLSAGRRTLHETG